MVGHSASLRMILHLHSLWVRILVGDSLIGDTLNGIELSERGYLPRSDLKEELTGMDVEQAMPLLYRGALPVKDGSTGSLVLAIDDLAWGYEPPIDEVQIVYV